MQPQPSPARPTEQKAPEEIQIISPTARKPELLAEKIGKSGVLNAAIGAKARIAIGKGICPVIVTGRDPKTGQEELEWLYDAEIEDWLELNNDYFNSLRSIRDSIGYGWTHARINMGNGHKNIAGYKTDDVVKCRLGVMNPASGEIEKTFLETKENTLRSQKRGLSGGLSYLMYKLCILI